MLRVDLRPDAKGQNKLGGGVAGIEIQDDGYVRSAALLDDDLDDGFPQLPPLVRVVIARPADQQALDAVEDRLRAVIAKIV